MSCCIMNPVKISLKCLRNKIYLSRASIITRQSSTLNFNEASVEDHEETSNDTSNFQLKKHPYQLLFPWKSKTEFAKHIVNQIVHNDDGLVVINKPFGVGVVNSKANKGKMYQTNHLRGIGTTDYSLEGILPFLKETLNKPDLVLVKGTERMTSGISVFADDLKQAEKFSEKLRISKFLSTQVKPLYNYQVITFGIPFTSQTTIKESVGMHLKSTPLLNSLQPVILRQFSNAARKKGDVKVVHVETSVLGFGQHKTALLEIQTSSIKWNFLRVYCAELLIPILGDHLYSCRVQSIMGIPTKIDVSHASSGSADQKLPDRLLQTLHVDDSIQIPPHMHLESYTLINYRGKGQDLKLKAPIPEYFEWTKKQLQLYNRF